MGGVVALGAALLLLNGCATPASKQIAGRMLHTPEYFTGRSTASISGDGDLILTSNRGAHCDGPYRQVADDTTGEVGADTSGTPKGDSGKATLRCLDGRTGSVLFLVGPGEAVGTGMLGHDIVTLTIGE
ncbi:MAG TPA: hypothetical protein VMW18_14090 [Candidatus Binatia bacterium]|nr:hypothetical protein [Candidatus Binatia bacterium]